MPRSSSVSGIVPLLLSVRRKMLTKYFESRNFENLEYMSYAPKVKRRVC